MRFRILPLHLYSLIMIQNRTIGQKLTDLKLAIAKLSSKSIFFVDELDRVAWKTILKHELGLKEVYYERRSDPVQFHPAKPRFYRPLRRRKKHKIKD